MSKILRTAALTLAAGSSVALMAGPANAHTAAAAEKGTLLSCLTTATAASANFSLTADGPDFKQALAKPKAGTQCASWSVTAGQYVVDVTENTTCTFGTATVTRDGRTKTFSTTAPEQNARGGLFGLTNVAGGKTTRVDWVYSC